MKYRRRIRLYGFYRVAFLAFLGALILGLSIFGIDLLGTTDGPIGRMVAPATTDSAEQVQRAAQDEADYVARAKQAAAEQAAKREAEAAKQRRSARRPGEGIPDPAVPTDTTMYLTVPKLGLYDIPVLEGTSTRRSCRRASVTCPARATPGRRAPTRTQRATGSRLPRHRERPRLLQPPEPGGREMRSSSKTLSARRTPTRSATYSRSRRADLSVTSSTGADIVSLQTCIENYGDYWTEAPTGSPVTSSRPIGSKPLLLLSRPSLTF